MKSKISVTGSRDLPGLRTRLTPLALRIHILGPLTVGSFVPVGTGELEVSGLDGFEEIQLIWIHSSEWSESTQQDVEDHSDRPHVDLQTITYMHTQQTPLHQPLSHVDICRSI